MGIFIENILLLKKIASNARDAFVLRVLDGNNCQFPLVRVSPNRWWRKSTPSRDARRIYPQRLAIAEPVFANIRINKRLDRFTLRGKVKVNIQWLMYCLSIT
jgi:hypothetical protein